MTLQDLSKAATQGEWYEAHSHAAYVRAESGLTINGCGYPGTEEAKANAHFCMALVNAYRSGALVEAGWQPIESAPHGAKDICWMMLAYGDPDDPTVSSGMRFKDQYFAAGVFHKGGPAGTLQFEFRQTEVQPFAWMPLPPAPATEQSEQEDTQ